MADVVDDLTVAQAAARGDVEAIRAVEERTFPGARAALARMGLARVDIDDVMQIVREHMFVGVNGAPARVGEAATKGDLRGLVRIIAIRTALNQRRPTKRQDPLDDSPMLEMLAAVDDSPELAVLKDQQRQAFKTALEQALTTLTPRDRNVLRMQVVHDLSIDDIGRAYSVHRATAARWLEAIRERIHAEARRLLHERLGVSDGELQAIYRLVASRIDVSFSRVLQVLPSDRENSR